MTALTETVHVHGTPFKVSVVEIASAGVSNEYGVALETRGFTLRTAPCTLEIAKVDLKDICEELCATPNPAFFVQEQSGLVHRVILYRDGHVTTSSNKLDVSDYPSLPDFMASIENKGYILF